MTWPLVALGLLAGVTCECGEPSVPAASNPGMDQPTQEPTMTEEHRIALASELMRSFAERTGIQSGVRQRRYLWTDAFAVCNFLGLARATGDDGDRRLALTLVERVHHTLGRHRTGRRATGLAPWTRRRGGRGAPDPRRAAYRQAAPRARARGAASTQRSRVGSGRAVLPLPHPVDARPRPDRSRAPSARSAQSCWARELTRTAHDALRIPRPGGRRCACTGR